MDVPEKRRAAAAATAAVAIRACDGCARRRARWYCAADVAFLCQSCDASVHTANPVARRHRRVRLKADVPVPSWQRGFKRRTRTPRRPHRHAKTRWQAWRTTLTVVPETSLDEAEEEEQLLYCVPVFEPAAGEFRSPPSSGDEAKPAMEVPEYTPASAPSEMELADFAADMESLLSGGLEAGDNYFTVEKLGLVDSTENVKTEKADEREEQRQVELEIDVDAPEETPEIDSSWLPGSSPAAEEEELEDVTKKAKLSIDYDAVIAAWSMQGASPWTNGERPEINLDGWWLDRMDVSMGGSEAAGSGEIGGGGQVDEGRQARVTRYREKRRMRLFSKKIRYEVRKLNAEKRPRMKGRFVKCAPVPVFAHRH